jgi:hypothetical protein
VKPARCFTLGNRFDFYHCEFEHIASFLGRIGRESASHIQSVRIGFPNFHPLTLHDVTIEDESNRILAKIQSECTSLSTLTASFLSPRQWDFYLLDDKIAAEALALANARFKAIASLSKIIVEICNCQGLSDFARDTMKSHGWTLRLYD